MTSENDTIYDRIRKCLILSKCSDENEAAAALLAAQRLMGKYNISESDVRLADIGEARAFASVKKTPPSWESWLADVVGNAFGCQVMFAVEVYCPVSEWGFIGLKSNVEIASYAFAVLLRRLKRARQEHIRRFRRYGKRRKIICGDLYCSAWVAAVEEKVQAFVGNKPCDEQITTYIIDKYKETRALATINRLDDDKNIKQADWASYNAGYQDGSDVTLQHGVEGESAAGCLIEYERRA